MKSCPECAEDVHWPAVEVCYDCGHRFDGLLSFAHANVKARALILVLTFATLASYGAYRVSGADARTSSSGSSASSPISATAQTHASEPASP
jgi:hypothetical protein